MKLNIQYNIDFETKRVQKTLEKLDWYNEQGYRPRLPDDISKQSTESEIKKAIEDEFDLYVYAQAEQQMIERFEPIVEEFGAALVEMFGESLEVVTINLTGYGVGGSYHLPSTIVINHHMSDLFKTVIHEVVHLMIQEQIEQHKIKHWEKERIVDLILNSEQFAFFECDSMQDTKGTEKYVDGLFNKHFWQDREKFFRMVAAARS
ncbi:hypothetical protein KKD71_00085 [Patescibacteria group bacterium]|nr:hypothetical protein [Patescibacteria group bacterium]